MGAHALSQAFAALADPTRRDIVLRLATDGESTVTALATDYDISLQAVAKHVTVLADAGLVSRRRQGRERPVRLEAEVLSMMTRWLERRRREAEARYRRLDALLAEDAPQHHHDPHHEEPS